MGGKPLRVLLVEDSPDDAELVELELLKGGFAPMLRRVETAGDMRMELDHGPWDVVLSDFHLPAFSAENALEVLHSSGYDLPFIILSGMVKADEAVKLMKRGAHDFLDKGALARLVPAIERELREAAERSRRRAAEEQVRILTMAVEQSPVAVTITDTDGIITYVNPQFCETSGYAMPEVMGRKPNVIKGSATPPEDFAALWAAIKAGQVWRGTFHNRRKDGTEYWDEASISPVRDPDGRVTHFVGITQDVTERQLRELELRDAMENLTKVNTELERFAYVASHDLQEPLRTLTSFTQLLQRHLGADVDEKATEYMGFIIGAAKRMHALINDLLAYSRATCDDRPLAPVSMKDACDSALRNLKSAIDETGAVVSVGQLPQVLGDEVQLMQLFQNLVGNAIKFRIPGTTPVVTIASVRKDEDWQIEVKDNGIGIVDSGHDIFEIFRRLHSQSEYPGTGLGLAICRVIANRHKGRIWVRSGEGEGSSFYFTIPAITP